MRALQVEPSVWLWVALLLLTVPLPWLLAAIIAVCIHELFHFAVLRAMGGQVLALKIGIGGMVMDTALLTSSQELCCALAGPAGSLLLVCLYRWLPRTALCGLVHGVFNLLPVYPLDGGRILRVLAHFFWRKREETVCRWAERAFLLLLFLLAAFAAFRCCMGIFSFLTGVYLIIRIMARKIPCKPGRLGVQ